MAVSRKFSIFDDTREHFASYGLEHFSKKYGLRLTLSRQAADIIVAYSVGETEGKAQVLLSKEAVEGTCLLDTCGEVVPIFQVPLVTNGECCLAMAVDGVNRFSCLSVSNETVRVGFDICGMIGRILAGKYDNLFLKKDEFGERLRVVPVVDVLEKVLFTAVCRAFDIGDPASRPLWPENHGFALVLTHDVDRVYKTYQYIPSLATSMSRLRVSDTIYHLKNLLFRRGKNNPYWTFETIARLETSLGVRSTFYFLNEKGKHNPFSLQSWILYRGVYDIESAPVRNVIRELDNAGFEIAVHGSYNSHNNPELLESEKAILESITGKKVGGVRQHYLNYENDVTPLVHDQCRFRHDSSIGFKPNSGSKGFRRGTSFPFRAMLPGPTISPVLEMPLIIMDGTFDRHGSEDYWRPLIDKVQEYAGVLTIVWHSNRFNDREYPNSVKTYEAIIDEARRRNAWIATANEVCDWLSTAGDSS